MRKGDSRIEVKTLKTKYPQGAERMLIYAVTGRKINSSMLPADAGCIVDNVDTVVAVCQAALKGKPLMERIMTVTGDAVKEPRNFLVPLGMLHQEVVNAAGGFRQEPQKVISGGPMMGKAMFSLDVPVIKTLFCDPGDGGGRGVQKTSHRLHQLRKMCEGLSRTDSSGSPCRVRRSRR